MKLPFTEKFLWDLYKIIVGDPNKHRFWLPLSMQELVYPEYSKLMRYYKSRQDARRFQKLISYLKNKGIIKIKEIENKEAILITPKGQNKISDIIIKVQSANLKKRKDKKWQMIMYDIPKNKNRERQFFRKELKLLGYQMIQKSIWASPYNVIIETRQLIEKYKFWGFVRVLLVQEINLTE